MYILKNEAFPSYLKIGISQTDFNRRLVGLNRESALPFPFEIVHIENFPGHQLRNAESLAHKLLKNYRVNKNREFFQVSPEIAVNTIKKINKVYAQPLFSKE